MKSTEFQEFLRRIGTSMGLPPERCTPDVIAPMIAAKWTRPTPKNRVKVETPIGPRLLTLNESAWCALHGRDPATFAMAKDAYRYGISVRELKLCAELGCKVEVYVENRKRMKRTP